MFNICSKCYTYTKKKVWSLDVFKMFLVLNKIAFIWSKIQKTCNIVKYSYNLKDLFLFEYILKCHLFLWCKADF